MASVTSLFQRVFGNRNHDATESGNPVGIGATSVATVSDLASPVSAAGDRTRAIVDRFGALIVRAEVNPLQTLVNNTAASTGDDDLIATPGASKRLVLHQLMVTCDAANTVDTIVKIAFVATATAGDNFIFWEIPPGGGIVLPCYKNYGGENEALVLNNTVPTGGSVSMGALYSIEDYS